MKIEPISNGSLRIWLTEEETEQWGLHTAAGDPGPPVRRLVRQALSMTGRRPPVRLLAEMIPVEGGCVLLVSPSLHPDGRQPAVYRVPDEDTLLLLREQWLRLENYSASGSDGMPCLSLYARDGGYDLVVYPVSPLTQQQMHLLLEYGDLLGCGEGTVAHCAEYGRLLAAGEVFTYRAPDPPVPGDPQR